MMSEIRPDIYWTHLYWLTVLEEQKSYTRAAEKLAVSKSAISQKISELERVTGKTLVHRTTRSVTLSEDGQRLVAELNEPFGQIREIFTGTCDDEGGPLRERCALPRRWRSLDSSWFRPSRLFCISTRSFICSWR